jgi:SAM-dependent methyltransferase
MRPICKEILKLWKAGFPIQEPVCEFGAFQVQPVEDDLRPIFSAESYIGTDMIPGPGVDVVTDLRKLSLEDNSIGTAVCVDTLEHVVDPFKALREMFRVLRPTGLLFLISVFNFPLHHRPDYWRFTPEGFEALFMQAGFTSCKVYALGSEGTPQTIAGIGSKGINLAEL